MLLKDGERVNFSIFTAKVMILLLVTAPRKFAIIVSNPGISSWTILLDPQTKKPMLFKLLLKVLL